jgi:hypothetical protein
MRNYVFGPDPNYWSDQDSRGNGTWRIQASDAEEALQTLLPGVIFHGELAGRNSNMFIPGISLEGVRAEDVVQIWSDDPDCVARTVNAVKNMDVLDRRGKSIGDVMVPTGQGLEKEIRVTDIPNLLAAWSYRLALPAPEAPEQAGVVSPLGSELSRAFSPQQQQITSFARLIPKMNMLIKRAELEESETALRAQSDQLEEQNLIHRAYQAGGSRRRILASGDRASAGTPYWIFPERLYLDEEVGLLMNLGDMDFRDMEALYSWLTEQGRWKKLLPQEKCILVTRLKHKPKDYNDPIGGMIYNLYNMEHIVWVRDGDFCAVLGCDLELDDPILPPADFMAETMRGFQEKVWEKHFKPRKTEKPGRKKDALWESEPYRLKVDPGLRRYSTLEDWLNSPDYGDEVKAAIQSKLQRTMVAHMRGQVPILAYLQGIVDRRGILQIPPGTDILGDQSGRWLRLGNAYATLYDSRARNTMDKILAPKNIAAGDWLVVSMERRPWTLVQVKSIGEDGFTVMWRERAKRGYYESYNKNPQKVVVSFQDADWIPWDKLAPDMIDLLLNDRSWKMENSALVPVLARWEELQKTVVKTNDTHIDLTRKA